MSAVPMPPGKMTDKETAGWIAWFKSRPLSVQGLVREFPPMTRIDIDGVVHYVLGYTETDMLIVSEQNPTIDLGAAKRMRKYICAKHLRGEECSHEH